MQFTRINLTLKILVVIYLLGRTAAYIINSFTWPMDGDLSFLYYVSWLMNEHDFVPYRDVHETSFFGTFIFYSTLTKCIGYSTLAFHIVDTIYFVLLSVVMFLLLKPFGKLVGLLAIGLFGEFYYQYGSGVHLQRDFVALLPVAIALFIATSRSRPAQSLQQIFVGALFGAAACIKPQFGLGLFPALALIYYQNESRQIWDYKSLLKILLWSATGFVMVWIAGLLWLYTHGVLNNFFDMTFNYLPQYSSINGRNYSRTTEDALSGAAKWLAGMLQVFLLPLLLSLFAVMRSVEISVAKKKSLIIIVGLWVLYLVYVPMAGKYWEYHILPSCYFLALSLSLILYKEKIQHENMYSFLRLGAWLILIWLFVLHQSFYITPKTDPKFNERMKVGTSELANFLKQNLRVGETIQSHVSHTHGPIFPALLQAHVMPATPYLENYLLYHDVDKPFVANARKQFMAMLQSHPPRFIIAGPTVFGFRGERTEQVFRIFEDWLAKNYHPVLYSSNSPDLGINEIYIVYEYNL